MMTRQLSVSWSTRTVRSGQVKYVMDEHTGRGEDVRGSRATVGLKLGHTGRLGSLGFAGKAKEHWWSGAVRIVCPHHLE